MANRLKVMMLRIVETEAAMAEILGRDVPAVPSLSAIDSDYIWARIARRFEREYLLFRRARALEQRWKLFELELRRDLWMRRLAEASGCGSHFRMFAASRLRKRLVVGGAWFSDDEIRREKILDAIRAELRLDPREEREIVAPFMRVSRGRVGR